MLAKRNSTIAFRVTADEFKSLRRAARAAGLRSASEFIRRKLNNILKAKKAV